MAWRTQKRGVEMLPNSSSSIIDETRRTHSDINIGSRRHLLVARSEMVSTQSGEGTNLASRVVAAAYHGGVMARLASRTHIIMAASHRGRSWLPRAYRIAAHIWAARAHGGGSLHMLRHLAASSALVHLRSGVSFSGMLGKQNKTQ